MLSANPDLTWRETVEILKDTSEKIDLNTTGYSGTVTDLTGYEDSDGFRICYSPSVDGTTRPLRQGQWKNKAGEYLFEPDGTTPTPGVTDTTPYHSEWYGHGRVNAKDAVQAAIDYSQADRDLVIRNTLADTGTAISAFGLDIDSPDIWVRNVEPLQETIDFNLLDYAEAAPHQQPLESSDRYVYARIKNIGSTYSNLEAKVRFYLVLDNPGTQFKFPDHFTESGDIATGSAGVKLLDEVTINAGDISASGTAVVKALWPANESDVNTALETSILVEITPHDGPFFGPGDSGEFLAHNNNLSRKKMVFREEIEITGSGGAALPTIVDVPSNDITTPVATPFNVHISDFVEFVTEDVKLIFTLNEFGTITTVEYRHDGSSWGFDTPPVAGWVSVDEPLKELYEPTDLATGNQRNVLFNGTINSPGTFDTVTIRAEYTNTGSESFFKEKTIDIDVQYLPSPTLDSEDPVEKNKIYFFSEYDLFTITQTDTEAFGPNPANLTHEYRTTSSHKASDHPKAFAVTTGQVMVQQTSDPNLVNVILKPRHQGAFDFLDVKYFVYRGIQKSQLIDTGDDELVAPTGTNPFITSIWDTQQAINEAIENADPGDAITPGSVTDQPSARSFGIQYVDTASEPWHVVKADTDSIDELFFDPVSDFRFPIVKVGQEFAKFDKDKIGFDIILNGMGDVTTFGEVRGTHNIVTVPTLGGSPTPLDLLTDRSKRAKILNFIDPAAFYGIHIFSGINAIDEATSTDKLLFENDTHDAYEFIIKLFYNRNKTYLDIRNENGYNFNYYDNYTEAGVGHEIKLSFDNSIPPAGTVFGTHSWPIRIIDNSELEGGETGDKNALFIEMPKGDNQQPLLYTPYASKYNKFPKPPKQKKRFIEVDFDDPNIYSDTIKFGIPNRSDNGDTTAIAWYVKMAYIRRNLPGNTAGTTMVPNGINTFDNVFPLLDVLPWESTNSVKFVSGYHSRYIEREDFAFVGDMGMALETDRVFLYSVPEDVYFSPGKKVGLFKRILGGTSNKSSFFEVLKNIFPDLGVQKRTLTIGGVEKNCLTYNDSGIFEETESDKRNFFCINMTKAEFDGLLLEGDTIGLDKDLHYPALVIDSVSVLADDNDNAYFKYDLKIAGINAAGDYVKAPLIVEAYSVDGIMVTTHDFAFSETSEELEEKCIEFDFNDQGPDYYASYGKVVKRISPFKTASGIEKNKWQLYTDTGADQFYVSGQVDNFGNTKSGTDLLEIPVGTRCILLSCRELPVSEFSSIQCVRIVCWHDGAFREGYISNLAFANSVDERVLPTEGFSEDELFNSFVNDCRLELHLAQAVAVEVTSPVSSGFLALLVDVADQMDYSDPDSIIQKYVNGSAADKTTIVNRIKGEGNILGLANSTYADSSGITRLDLPKTLQSYVDKVTALGLIEDPNFEFIPLAPDLLPTVISGLTPYDADFATELTTNASTIVNEFYGNSGSTSGRDPSKTLVNDTDFNSRVTQLANIRTWLTNKKAADPTSPIVSTKEADWFLDPVRGATAGTGGADYFIDKVSLVYLSSQMIRNINRPGFRARDYIAEGIPIDQSFGPLNSDNVFSVFIHELNVSAGIDIVQFAGDTHFRRSKIPLYPGSFFDKPVGETAWRYVRDNDFATFNGHGFKPNGTYLEGGLDLGSNDNTKTQNIADFFQRNPSLGVVYMKLYLDKILQGL